MRATLLGSGDATGVPVPLCDCQYCTESDRRRNPSLLVETGATTVVFDVGPHVDEQLSTAGVADPDGFFLTHAHGDHAAGIPRLGQAAKWDADHLAAAEEFAPSDPETFATDYRLYLTATAADHVESNYYGLDRFDDRRIEPGETVEVGDLRVTATAVDHARPSHDTLAFAATDGEATVCYAPDMRSFLDGPPDADPDLLVCEGAALLGQPVHGPEAELRAAIESVGADRVVLVNVNEHLQRAHTHELRDRIRGDGYELGADFRTYEV